MKRRAQRPILCFILCLLLSAGTGAGFCVSPRANPELFMRLNERLEAEGTARVIIKPEISGNYIFDSFSKTPVTAALSQDGEIIASGTLPITCALRADAEVLVSLSSAAPFTFEVMRASLGRNARNPIQLTHLTLNRSIARAYDVHWYRFTAEEDGTVLFRTLQAVNGGVRAQLTAMSEDGRVLAPTRAASDGEGAFVDLRKGDSCLLRVCAQGEATGKYALSAVRAAGGAAPENIALESAEFALQVGQWLRAGATLSPKDALGELLWESSDEGVATVSSEGVVAAAGEGACTVTAYGFGGASAEARVVVSRAQVAGISFASDTVNAAKGDAIYLHWLVDPPYAGDTGVTFASSNEAVAAVNGEGLVTCAAIGEATITVTANEGGFQAATTVVVSEPAPIYRALLVGVSAYADGRERTGAINTTQGIADALTQPRYSSANYLTDMRLDIGKGELFSAIKEAFEGAAAADVNLFYINCHGGAAAGTAWLETYDGEKVSARELEAALREIPGTIVVIIDCCNSGAFIGQARAADFHGGVVRAFSSGGKNAFASAKYKVLTSSSFDQNSYRIASESPAVESNMATVFARALAEGLGWNLIKDKTSSIKADLDKNRQITLHEAYLYAYRRTQNYLSASSARQSVQVWPRGDAFVLVK